MPLAIRDRQKFLQASWNRIFARIFKLEIGMAKSMCLVMFLTCVVILGTLRQIQVGRGGNPENSESSRQLSCSSRFCRFFCYCSSVYFYLQSLLIWVRLEGEGAECPGGRGPEIPRTANPLDSCHVTFSSLFVVFLSCFVIWGTAFGGVVRAGRLVRFKNDKT